MPPGYNFSINVIYLSKYCRSQNPVTITSRYPGENAADIASQATYWTNIHGYVGPGSA